MSVPTPTRAGGRLPRIVVGGVLAASLGFATATATASASTEQAPAQTSDVVAARAPGKAFDRTELYFGSLRSDGTVVTDEEFDKFVDTVVTPLFPDGLTQLTGEGQFRGASGVAIEEKSFLVILLYPTNDRGANREIEEIRTEYKEQFAQESVLRADSRDRVSF